MRIISKLLSLVLLLSLTISVQAKSHIAVHFPGSEDQSAALFAFQDMMNYEMKKVDEKIIHKNARFSFDFHVAYTQKLMIRVGYAKFSFYVEPGVDYDIYVDTLDFTNPALYPIQVVSYVTPHYTVTRVGEGEDINQQLTEFSTIYGDFMNRNYVKIYRKQDIHAIIDSARIIINNFKSSTNLEYAKVNADIQLAQLQLMSRQYDPKQFVEDFFTADKIQHRNMAYMDFFNMYWKRYLLTKAKAFTRFELENTINGKESYSALDALLAKDSLLQDSVLRQLVVLRNLQDMYVSRKFTKQAINTILLDIAGQARHPEHQTMATNMRKIFSKYERGAPAEEFSLISFDQKVLHLEDFKGKYVVISVFNLNCLECLAEMNYMVELNEEFDDIIQFISVSVDQDPLKAHEYVEKNGFKWLFAYYNHDFIDDYNVSMLPYFILIDKEGNVENYSCPYPSQYFQDYFIQMLNEKKGNLD
jgi:peroxiredoxin